VPDISLGGASVSELFEPSGISPATMIDLATRSTDVWWRRLWVIQECATCKNIDVVAGDRVMGWDIFKKRLAELSTVDWIRECSGNITIRRPFANDVHISDRFRMGKVDQDGMMKRRHVRTC
jgi:hypothetical protein